MFTTATYYVKWITLRDAKEGTKIVIQANDIIYIRELNTDPGHTSTIIYLDAAAEISPINVREDAATILSMITNEK